MIRQNQEISYSELHGKVSLNHKMVEENGPQVELGHHGITNNRLSLMPESIGQLMSLEELYLVDNAGALPCVELAPGAWCRGSFWQTISKLTRWLCGTNLATFERGRA